METPAAAHLSPNSTTTSGEARIAIPAPTDTPNSAPYLIRLSVVETMLLCSTRFRESAGNATYERFQETFSITSSGSRWAIT